MMMSTLDEFCDATALNTGVAAVYNIGSQLDMVDVREQAAEVPVYLVISVSTAVTSAGAATVQFQLVSDAIATPDLASASKHWISQAFGKAELVAGAVVAVVPLPFGALEPYERYLGVQQITGVAALTAGAVNAFLTTAPQTWVAQADATN